MEVEDLLKLIQLLDKKEIKKETKIYEVGKKYLIRTVTMTQVGKLKIIGDKELVLEDASWVADTGRFNEALQSGYLNELEPFVNDAIVGRGAICDATEWSHDLPKGVK